MKRSTIVTVAVICSVLLAGCGGLDPGNFGDASDGETDGDGPNATEATPATTTETPTETRTETPTATPTETPEESWSEPEQPNRPQQDNRDEEEGHRIKSIEVTGSGGGEDGSASFRIDVTANTSMPDVDPPEYGSVRGEPYFLVYMDASTENDSRFTYIEGDLVERSPELSHEEEGEYTLTVPQEAFEHYDAEPGEHELMILLMDEDKDYDDIYGLERIPVEYDPGEE